MFGKLLSLYLVLLMFKITVMLFACLSGMNDKAVNLGNTINLGLFALIYSATLYHICNYAHYFANIVRYKNIFLNIYIYIYMCVCVCAVLSLMLLSTMLVTKIRNKILPPSAKYERSIPGDGTLPIQYNL